MFENAAQLVIVAFLVIGALFCLLASVGIFVMTDLFIRMQAASKSVTLGVTAMVFGVGLHFHEPEILIRCVLICIFMFITIPVASHIIARAAYRTGESLAPETIVDELASVTPGRKPLGAPNTESGGSSASLTQD